MPNVKPTSQEDVLRSEYAVLRPREAAGSTGPPDTNTEPESAEDPLTGLCISGGGIRSATFSLGVLQGLAELGLLQKLDYLSTVSGGGYIGSWLTAWATRAGGIEAIVPQLLPADSERVKAGKESEPIAHLREYNSYLSPRRGALTADTWTLVSTVARNIVLNWLVLLPLLLVVLMVPRWYFSLLTYPERRFGALSSYQDPAYNALSQSALIEHWLPLACMALFSLALFNTLRFLPSVGGLRHDQGAYYKGVLGPLIAAVLGFLLFDSLFYLGSNYTDYGDPWRMILLSIGPCALAWALFAVSLLRRPRAEFGRVVVPVAGAILVMAAGTGAASWTTTNIILWSTDPDLAPSWETYVTTGPPLALLGYCLATILFVGFTSRFLRDEDREWMSRAVAGALIACVAWVTLCAVVLTLPEVALDWHALKSAFAVAIGGSSAWLTSVSSAWPKDSAGGDSPGLQRRMVDVAAAIAPLVFIVVLSVGLSILVDVFLGAVTGIDWWKHDRILIETPFGWLLALTGTFLVISGLMARYVNINTFSLHGMYRDRLVRAYLGASRCDRRPNPFTGFDRHDDLPVTALAATKPFHILNFALNLVRSTHLAWQQRKAASFVVTPLHAGSSQLGYRPSGQYAGGISLGTSVAISGAAASPNMGYRSTPLRGFIMTLFNARQGVWLGNTGVAGEKVWKEPSPRSALGLMTREALGLTSERSAYVYLSDGGHFENLALYEMIRRRCRFLVVIDAGCDPDFVFEDLGNALRKIRIDFGVSIEFDDGQFAALRAHNRRCATATIRYSDADPDATDGRLLYIKPTLLGDESPDVRSYADAHPTFPHETTSDQWFDESQTESYRQLGLHSVRKIAGKCSIHSLRGLIEEAGRSGVAQ